MSKQQVVREIHRYARKNFQRRKITMYGIADTLQADLIEMQPYAKENRGHRYILIVIDVFSKMAYAEPLMNKTGLETAHTMERIIERVQLRQRHKINHLQNDNGTEFYSKHMRQLLQKYNINHYSIFSLFKACVVERLIRTIKRRLYIQFSLQGNYQWLKILQKVIESYNDTW